MGFLVFPLWQPSHGATPVPLTSIPFSGSHAYAEYASRPTAPTSTAPTVATDPEHLLTERDGSSGYVTLRTVEFVRWKVRGRADGGLFGCEVGLVGEAGVGSQGSSRSPFRRRWSGPREEVTGAAGSLASGPCIHRTSDTSDTFNADDSSVRSGSPWPFPW
ncbi:hypothetical protein GCM10010324_18630 [Streptomyces hiroshimensis]|uniref:Uncharacterized protein n=1 Tax=Streptomyces hiroshimensis TaxID=66424 RepID=A0ABQ2Y925_9ACTN|nr:hypothetical protein GCM10010324_18630 [Streptomyces hiroshimensis]